MPTIAVLLLLTFVGTEHAFAITPGTVLGPETAEQAADLLPPDLLEYYRTGAYRNEVQAWPDRPVWSPAFLKATAANVGRYDVTERGTIVAKDTGTVATGIHGLPFTIDASDDAAGVKAIWNAYYALWRIGSTEDILALDWIGRQRLERQAVLRAKTLYYEGVSPAFAPKENPLNLAAQQHSVVTAPADLNDTATLAWRYRDADKHDQSWTYAPALRRVRQVSPANRSDGFLGSDMSQDDGAFFDGKPEDFVWRLVGAREGLALADPTSLAGTVKRRDLDGGGFAELWPAGQQVIGYQDRDWTGAAWAPRSPVLVQRKLWVVEAVPRDPYYLFRRLEISLDQQTFQGVASRKFDAQGALLRSLQFLTYASQPIGDDGEVLSASSMGYIVAVNVRADRATVAGTVPPGNSVHRRRLPLAPRLFALDELGKGK